MCPLCLEWFLPLPRQQDCILEYILPTKSKRAKSCWIRLLDFFDLKKCQPRGIGAKIRGLFP
ncbi:MAG: hypothetical protein EWV40_02820 [Microcystis flos-aquae Mf_WU_F_19750830_S460]|uniref:Uncharacterized protein n=1 Tax=Microcystis flos-aquae Mf_WU_F_19750830_S460 TaxID=2486237 RepID=A0A552M209_9CHRO|nr:MAG: hypothetical protein EWV40_02820 [Microcystis flos-aquae Mf_WU_F_19750830_S460]